MYVQAAARPAVSRRLPMGRWSPRPLARPATAGEVGVDDALVNLQAEEQVFEMNNGCICCTGASIALFFLVWGGRRLLRLRRGTAAGLSAAHFHQNRTLSKPFPCDHSCN